eukprot:10033663-Ditylum_brightwellii.AAC.1
MEIRSLLFIAILAVLALSTQDVVSILGGTGLLYSTVIRYRRHYHLQCSRTYLRSKKNSYAQEK